MTYTKCIKKIIQVLLLLAAVSLMAGPSFAATFDLAAVEATWTPPGSATPITMWGFINDPGSCPGAPVLWNVGPTLNVPAGDSTLTINLRNCLAEPVSVVIPGQPAALSPVTFTDAQGRQRVLSFTTETLASGTSIYTWNNLKPGTFIYHSGSHPALQVQMGPYGAVTVTDISGSAYPGIAHDNEVILFYSEIDPVLHTPATVAQPLNYRPKHFLVNGEQPNPAVNAVADHPITAGEQVLIRFLNMGLKTHVPSLNDQYISVIAEDGNLYPYPKNQYSVLLPAGKTMDAIWTAPSDGGYPVYDRSHSPGGMLIYLQVGASSLVATDDTYSVNEDAILTVVAPGVLTGETGTTAVLNSSTTNGAIVLNTDGSFTYTPNANFNGTDIFTYRSTDGITYSNVATVTITVNPINDAPVAVDDTSSTVEATAVIINVLANDTDVDGDPLTVSFVTQGTNGLVVINPDNTVTYTPTPGFTGTDTFTYTANDGTADSNVATVTVTVNPHVNTPPVATDDYASTTVNVPVTINVVLNDTDPDGTIDPTTVAIVTQPTRGGSVVNHNNGTVTFTPKKNFRGTDTFTYTVNDNEGATSNVATVRVNVVR
ncbi:MAG: Ig-like domain-containing protein [Nitrospirota bacterium]